MARRAGRDLAVGALFTLALVVLALGVMVVGEDSRLMFSSVEYSAVFPNADGLLVGAPVRMAGVQIGTVTRVRLPTELGQDGISVRLGLDQAYADRIRDDSRAGLRILQILTSEKFVEITPGSAAHPPLPPGGEIAAEEQVELFERGWAIAENLADVTVALRDILEPLQKGQGLLGGMIQDPEFGKEGLEALRGSLENVEAITTEIRAGRGTLGRLLADDELGAKLDDLGSAIESLSALVHDLSRREGALGELTREGGAGEQAIRDLRDAAATLKRVADRIDSGESVLGNLLFADCLDSGKNLCETLSSIAEVTDKINRGEGTLGALVNDRSLHDGAQEIVGGVENSRFARWLLQHYRKKGIKAESNDAERETGEEPGPP